MATVIATTENNFTKGLITEASGLNFPENAATFTTNCIYTITGDVLRRLGITNELNGNSTAINRSLMAMTTYVWNNPAGDSNSKLLVKQVGGTLYFYNISTSTDTTPLSTQILISTVSLTATSGGTLDTTKECTYADGNGYLFVYHPSCDPSYVTYNLALKTFTITPITLQIRDFVGTNDGLQVNTRPTTLSSDHSYNLQNQGWTTSNPWSGFDTTPRSNPMSLGSNTFNIGTGLTISNGTDVQFNCYFVDPTSGQVTGNGIGTGSVTGYSGGILTLNVFAYTNIAPAYIFITETSLTPISIGYVSTWFAAVGNYPSNADVWWYFKDSSDAFDPTTTVANVDLSTGQAPQGHYLLPAFNMNRSLASGISGLTTVSTMKRPTNGCWFQGRVFYTGVSDTFPATGDANSYSWSDNVYFSTTVQTASDFSSTYQTNDPTSENLFDELPTDGGVFPVVGSGTIHKLYSIANGLLIFANNGIWFCTGSQGIGFAANDFTLTKISSVKVLSHSSFVDVNGYPMFWNEEGIYQVTPAQGGQLSVEPVTVSTILSYYSDIPLASKKYARGSYDSVNYIIEWCYRSTQESSVTDRYQFDTILAYNVYTKSFYVYNISGGSNTNYIHGVDYISYPYISTVTPDPSFKYHCSDFSGGVYNHSFAEEYDTSYVDWNVSDFTSQFITGYKLHGKGLNKTQVPYVYTFSRTFQQYTAFYIQALWDYAVTSDSNKWSQRQFVEIYDVNSSMVRRQHKLRGQGAVLQFMITSVPGQPFDIMGWSVYETSTTGP